MITDCESSGHGFKEKLITIRIQSILDIKRALGARETEFLIPEETNVRQLLQLMAKHWGVELADLIFQPDSQEPVKYVQLLVNSRSINFLNGLDTELNDNDIFLIFPPAGGG